MSTDEILPKVIGLTGKLGSGKDTVLLRLRALFGEQYQRVSFADPLKESAAALLDIDAKQLDAMKNEPQIRITIADLKGAGRDLGRSFSIREFLQRYGTEAHREVFGDDFWVQQAIKALNERSYKDSLRADMLPPTYVFTDVRFENEAQAIIDAGGMVFRVIGPDVDTGAHASEAGIPDEMVIGEIDNSWRPQLTEQQLEELTPEQAGAEMDRLRVECVQHLDDELAKLHGELTS